MKSRRHDTHTKEFRKWLKEYLCLLEKAQNIQHLPDTEQQKLLRNQHPFILDELTKKGMTPVMREMLDSYLQILLKHCA